MVRESGVDAGPYVMLRQRDLSAQSPQLGQVHQVLGTTVADLMRKDSHSCQGSLPLPKAASQLHDRGTQRLFVVDDAGTPIGVLTRGDVVRALASQETI